MRKGNFITFLSAFLIILSALLFFPSQTVPTITYFPLDPKGVFKETKNVLHLDQKKQSNAYSVTWENHSESNEPLFLRQDVSILFRDGQLIGVKSIWKEDAKTIDFSETFHFKKDHLFQSVALHYGEKHYPNEVINSLQKMSYSELPVKGKKKNGFMYYQQPKEQQDPESHAALQKEMRENLLHHWHRLTSHFNVDLAQYNVVPLTELHEFQEKALMSFTQEQTDEIIAKLWEGLYKNYIIPISKNKDVSSDSYVPLILFEKNEHHILVLFELNGEKIKLKQVYPEF